MKEYSKEEKRRLRELAKLAYERELKKSLSDLSTKFDDWKLDKITSLQLNKCLHEYEQGESRDIWSMYDTSQHDMVVARAFVKNILTKNDIGPDILPLLDRQIKFYQDELSKRN